jgi:hypothetical protein
MRNGICQGCFLICFRMEAKKKSETADALKELDNIEVLNLPAPKEKVPKLKTKKKEQEAMET